MDLRKQEKIQGHFDQMYRQGHTPWTEHGKEPLISTY